MMRIASPSLGPSVLAMGRIVVATLTLALIMRLLGQRWPWRDWREMTLLALVVVAAPFFLFSQASVWLPAGYVALVNSTGVIYGTLVSAWFKEDTLTAGKLVGCLCGAVGVGLIVQLGPIQPTPTVLLGTLAASLGAVCFGFSMPMMKRTSRRIDPLAIAGPLHLFAIPWIAPLGLSSLPQAQFSTSAVVVVLVLGVFTSSLAFWMQLRILRHVTPVASMMPMFFVPLFGVAWGHLVLGEALGAGIYLGGALVLLAGLLVTGINPWQFLRSQRP